MTKEAIAAFAFQTFIQSQRSNLGAPQSAVWGNSKAKKTIFSCLIYRFDTEYIPSDYNLPERTMPKHTDSCINGTYLGTLDKIVDPSHLHLPTMAKIARKCGHF